MAVSSSIFFLFIYFSVPQCPRLPKPETWESHLTSPSLTLTEILTSLWLLNVSNENPLPYILIAQAVFLFHLDYFDNLLTGLIASTLTSLLFSRSEMQVDNFIPLLKILQ